MTTRLWKVAGIAAIAASAIACSNSDAAITTQVMNKLVADESTKRSQIDVTTVDNVVTLTGTVDSESAKAKAAALARSTNGVSDVVDKLAVITASAQSGTGLSPATGQQPDTSTAGMAGVGPGMMDMHRGEMGMPPEGMMREMGGMAMATPSTSSTPMASGMTGPAARPLSALPGVPGVSHLYHIGSTGFFLDQPQVRTTSDQQTALRRIMERALLERDNANRRSEEAEQELWALTGAGTEGSRVESKIAEIEKTRTSQRIEFIRAVGEAIEVLTPEQRNALLGTNTSK